MNSPPEATAAVAVTLGDKYACIPINHINSLYNIRQFLRPDIALLINQLLRHLLDIPLHRMQLQIDRRLSQRHRN